MNALENQSNKIFVSYSHSDKKWLERLQIHLRPLEQKYEISVWDATKIKPGSNWKKEIENALDYAEIAILLISGDFLASEFITTNELPTLLEAAEHKGTLILPVIISPSLFSSLRSLSRYQAVNSPSKPLINMAIGEQEEVLVKVSEIIENKLKQLDKSESTRIFESQGHPIVTFSDTYAVKTQETIVNIEICYGDSLKRGKPQNICDAIYTRFHVLASEAIKSHRGEIWLSTSENITAVFPIPQDAITGCIEFLNGLATLNGEQSALQVTPLFVRIGIGLNSDNSILSIPVDQRNKHSDSSLDQARSLQNRSPVGGIAISEDVYKSITSYQNLFRPTPGAPYLVLQNRPLSPQESELAKDLTDKQKQALPALCFLSWQHIRPDKTLRHVRQILSEDDLMVILGDTSSQPRGPLQSAATSDAVGLIEALAILQPRDIRVGIDEWQDTADLVVSRNVLIVGSGASNMYALLLNDIFEPLQFVRSYGRALDQIVAGPSGQQKFFGNHGTDPSISSDNSGLILISKSVFNPTKHVIWMAGIRGMGTQAVAAFLKDLLKGQAEINDAAVGCVINPVVKTGVKVDVSEYFRKWRVFDYKVIHQVDRDGNKVG